MHVILLKTSDIKITEKNECGSLSLECRNALTKLKLRSSTSTYELEMKVWSPWITYDRNNYLVVITLRSQENRGKENGRKQ